MSKAHLCPCPRVAQRDALSAKVASQARSTLALFLARDRKGLCLLEARESGRMLSSQAADELKLVFVRTCTHSIEWVYFDYERSGNCISYLQDMLVLAGRLLLPTLVMSEKHRYAVNHGANHDAVQLVIG